MRKLILASLFALACDGGGDTPDDTEDSEVEDSEVDTEDSEVDTEDSEDTEDTEAACWTPSDVGDCWSCDLPTTPEDDSLKALNRCNDALYAAFDNTARIPASTWVPGTPLPPVP